jgi:hypothetical protein
MTASLSTTLSSVLRYHARQLRVCTPGRVQSYNPETQRADCVPLIQPTTVLPSGDIHAESLPLLPDVPVLQPRAGGFFVHLPVRAGDTVLLLFCDDAIDEFLQSDGTAATKPRTPRLHSISDAVAIPGFCPDRMALSHLPTDHLVLGNDTGLRITVSAEQLTVSSADGATADPVARSSLVEAELEKLRSAIDAIKSVFSAHVHAGPTGPVSPTSVAQLPQIPPSVGSVASAVLSVAQEDG